MEYKSKHSWNFAQSAEVGFALVQVLIFGGIFLVIIQVLQAKYLNLNKFIHDQEKFAKANMIYRSLQGFISCSETFSYSQENGTGISFANTYPLKNANGALLTQVLSIDVAELRFTGTDSIIHISDHVKDIDQEYTNSYCKDYINVGPRVIFKPVTASFTPLSDCDCSHTIVNGHGGCHMSISEYCPTGYVGLSASFSCRTVQYPDVGSASTPGRVNSVNYGGYGGAIGAVYAHCCGGPGGPTDQPLRPLGIFCYRKDVL